MCEPLYYKQAEYKDKNGKTQNVFTLTKQTKFFLCLEKRKKKVLGSPFDYLNQYCQVKMALVIEGIFMSKTVVSLQIKVHECYVKPLKPRQSLLTIK